LFYQLNKKCKMILVWYYFFGYKKEFEKVKKHPSFSVEILKKYGETKQRLLDIIEQHHEKCHGSAYPKGLKKDEIDLDYLNKVFDGRFN